MAKSRAKKYRDHRERNGIHDVTRSRGNLPHFSTHVRKTKTKQGKWNQLHTKHKKRSLHQRQDEGSFLFLDLAVV
ncbi:hypothetical protein [Alteribacter populi]|uniref:hypothetical protein n=1 Tax=Alteribacter populi TaxID=2011011 RepID=UPI000BBB0B16|nr:hypothetical protein [Alteribacter populi]